MKKTMWDLKEERLEQRLQALAQQEDWAGVVQALDDYDKNNDRRHEDRRDDFDLSCLNGGISADGHYQILESLKLYEEDDWLDIIFSQQAGDLPNLVAEYPVSGYVAAVSAGIVDDVPLLDLCYEEDSSAMVDLNCVMDDQGRLIEIQGTGEERPFTLDEQRQLVELCEKGIRELQEIQRSVLEYN